MYTGVMKCVITLSTQIVHSLRFLRSADESFSLRIVVVT